MDNILNLYYPTEKYFRLQDLVNSIKLSGCTLSDETIRKKLKKAVDNGELIKAGRNCYCICKSNVCNYSPYYSEYALSIADVFQKLYPKLDFSLFELIQLNEFVNHQIAHNTIFIAVESDAADFVFNSLKLLYPGKILVRPTPEMYHQYWIDNMIVITKLVSQRPVFKLNRWKVRLETMLVDLFSDAVIRSSIGESEYPEILENAFHRYVLDENSLFRYAKRRNSDNKIRNTIEENTDIVLRTKE